MRTQYFQNVYAWLKMAFWISAFITGVVFAVITLSE